MFIEFMIATICLPLLSMETGEIISATELEIQLMKSIMSDTDAVSEQELMTQNCYEVTIQEK